MKRDDRNPPHSAVSPAFVGLVSGILSITLTVSGTLVTLKSGFSEAQLFPILIWILFVSGGAFGLTTLWILVDAFRSERSSLNSLRELEAFVPRLIRFRKRSDRFEISADGNALLKIQCEVYADGSASVPWVAFPMLAEVPPDRAPWTSIEILRVTVDGQDFDAKAVFVRKSRRHVEDDPHLGDRVVEDGFIRVPVSLDDRKRRCEFYVELNLLGAFTEIAHEEMCYTDVSYVTDELKITVVGDQSLNVTISPFAQNRVEAFQLGMDLLDVPESQRQSAKCRATNSVVWRSNNTKLGYRYRVAVRGSKPSK